MSVTPPRVLHVTSPPLRDTNQLVSLLLADGVVTQDDAHAAEAIARRQGLRVADVLSTNYGIAALTIAQAYATLYDQPLSVAPNPCPLGQIWCRTGNFYWPVTIAHDG